METETRWEPVTPAEVARIDAARQRWEDFDGGEEDLRYIRRFRWDDERG